MIVDHDLTRVGIITGTLNPSVLISLTMGFVGGTSHSLLEISHMADQNRYPQIPGTVWWGVRSILQKTPAATFDERFLSVSLDVQEVAARQYIAELKAVGILNEEGKATPLALKWRIDDTYSEAVDELVAGAYPEGLRNIAQQGELDRQQIVNWFLKAGLGQGAAGNKAATYLLISMRQPNEPSNRGGGSRASKDETRKRSSTSAKRSAVASSAEREPAHSDEVGRRHQNIKADTIPLNVNVQIHISADANSEQIESIFSAMKRYLYDSQNI